MSIGNKKINYISNEFKFTLCVIVCVIVHSSVMVFGWFFHVYPLMIFNIFSVAIYTLCLFLVKSHQRLVYYYAFVEIVFHSFVSVILIGHDFGFSMYFILLVPISYNMLYSINVKRPILKSTVVSVISCFFYALCYYLAKTREPIYQSQQLSDITPYVYVVNIMFTYGILGTFSILFLLETEAAFGELNNKNKELGILANTDPLTGLYNRRTMAERIKKLYGDYKGNKTPFSLIICDIDDFKRFNDTYGHDCGDAVLKSIAKELTSLTRDRDYLCRWGGEEFLILLNCIEIEKAREIAERFRTNIEKMEVSYNDLNLHISMTFGVACVVEAESYNHLFKIADERLYEGKNSGKNCVK